MAEKSLESNFKKLDEITAKMEDKDISLEEMFRYYKSGIELIKESNEMIDTIEKKIMIINDEGQTVETL